MDTKHFKPKIDLLTSIPIDYKRGDPSINYLYIDKYGIPHISNNEEVASIYGNGVYAEVNYIYNYHGTPVFKGIDGHWESTKESKNRDEIKIIEKLREEFKYIQRWRTQNENRY